MLVDSEDDPLVDLSNVSPTCIRDVLCSLEYAKKTSLKGVLVGHSISFPSNATCEVIRSLLSHHISSGSCLWAQGNACHSIVVGLIQEDCALVNQTEFQILIMSTLVKTLLVRSLRRIFDNHNVYYEAHFSLSKLRCELRKFITRLRAGKTNEEKQAAMIEAERKTVQK